MKDGNKLFSWLEGVTDKEKLSMLEIEKIEPNPYQPRRVFSEDKIKELAESIKSYGLLQAIIVRQSKNDSSHYQLVAGERRYLACKSLGMKKIPAVIKELSDNAVATIALIENLQRENLNYIEEAEGYERLINEFNFTQEVLAQRLGKSQSTIANKLRLLKLPDKVKASLMNNEEVTERHARALLKLKSEEEQEQVVSEIVNDGMNVKQAESRVDEVLKKQNNKFEERKYSKSVVRDLRIFLNTIRQAIYIIKKSGLNPVVVENDGVDYFEINIKLPKKQKEQHDNVKKLVYK